MIKKVIGKVFNRFGYQVTPIISPDMDIKFQGIYEVSKDYTVTSIERMYALYHATQYIVSSNIPGDIVECGVWKGGSMMLVAWTLKMLGSMMRRKLYLYDTYEGMTEPTEKDIDYKGKSAIREWKDYNDWCVVSLPEVMRAMYLTEYPVKNIVFTKGKVEDTIPKYAPDRIAILRLDTDWYESTYHELVHLYPRLVPCGILIIDDYGHFRGVKEAVDQYFKENDINIFLNRIDYTGRIAIKVGNNK